MAVLLVVGAVAVEVSVSPSSGPAAATPARSPRDLPPLPSPAGPRSEPSLLSGGSTFDPRGEHGAGGSPVKGHGFGASGSVLDASKTTESSQEFVNPDGSRTSELSTGPVRFRDAKSGQWQAIDPAPVDAGDHYAGKSMPPGSLAGPGSATGSTVATTTTPTLSVSPVTDPDGDPIKYMFSASLALSSNIDPERLALLF
jgi:hypothetical protein